MTICYISGDKITIYSIYSLLLAKNTVGTDFEPNESMTVIILLNIN